MIKATSQGKTRTRLACWLSACLATAGQHLHADGDLAAIEHGWQIQPRQGGLGRRYRDPRFDAFETCPACAGNGATLAGPCPMCLAAGRLSAFAHPGLAAGEAA